jgi:hypothetical protein
MRYHSRRHKNGKNLCKPDFEDAVLAATGVREKADCIIVIIHEAWQRSKKPKE